VVLKGHLLFLKNMQILTKTGTRVINFIPRQTIIGAKVYSLVIKSEGQNKVILTDNAATFTELDYYFQYSTTQALEENNYYTITITNTTDGIVIFKDKMYCTDQTLSDYEISNGVYIEQSTGNNEFVYYG
tara:strand:+ start:81 stop:470 length:390 start_codon:yes stop_codon:yes gene_type:complete